MQRAFPTSRTRTYRSLDGRWEFVPDPNDVGERDAYYDSFPADHDGQYVPGTWNTTPEYYDHEDPAWYHRSFHLQERTDALLRFTAVAHEATVWVDGREVASHYGGYTPFRAHLSGLDTGTHDVTVRVDNSRTPHSLPLPDTDWFPYGGITREVFLETVPTSYLDDPTVRYRLDGDVATVTAEVLVRNTGEASNGTVTVEVGDERVGESVTVPSGESVHEVELGLDVERWSLDDPTLYDVRATFSSETGVEDELRDRIGFREVDVTERSLLLNGEPVDVAGVNRHEDHPDWGHAVPLELMERDLDIIERLGCNTIRTSHYPNHPYFLDLCDERGILVLEEIPYWQYDGDDFAREHVLERGERMLGEMIERDRHHPSVVAWSLHNECYNHQDGVADATRRLAEVARERDDSRPLTLASNTDWRGHEDRCLQYVDFVCLNAYWGWYRDDRNWDEFLEEVREHHPEKPILVSEFGAGAIQNERTWDDQKWSETYQADLLERAIDTFDAAEYVTGWTVWQYCDTRTDPRKAMKRPKTKNNKGIVDEFRRPKEAYWRLQGMLDDGPN
ncbi:glycoside hydrolase family 2 protein [Halococcus hamelinensis]|uniref:Beta-glucuronidase n=1 Tax=Halococcus hamelinensis 100A6 TaxID=1132509 RepID=M0LWT3_9EURY|nr:glycoside hydrolase family 2 TIM barrel-domain containing protein [Halococcus hamelinensis]EMA38017.1 beta-galactosidase [Halococcus hamelinensis 100A6]